MRLIFGFLILAGVLSSCDDSRVYEQNYDFEKREWLVNDKPAFEFEINDTVNSYHLNGYIRNSVSFPYSRLFVNFYLEDSSGVSLQKKMMETFLFDPKTGKPLGTSGLGDIYDQVVPIFRNYHFPYAGKYKMKFEQFMRTDSLQGVLAVGLRIEKVKKY